MLQRKRNEELQRAGNGQLRINKDFGEHKNLAQIGNQAANQVGPDDFYAVHDYGDSSVETGKNLVDEFSCASAEAQQFQYDNNLGKAVKQSKACASRTKRFEEKKGG